MKTLPALLNSSNMLACGEDLGLIPSCVHPVCLLYVHPTSLYYMCRSIRIMSWGCQNISFQVMQELGLVGLRIQRMPSESDVKFGIPSNYDYMTVRFFFSEFCLSLLASFHLFPEELVMGK